MSTVLGVFAVAAGGFIIGISPWPYKFMRTYQFEHWLLLASVCGTVVYPWIVILWGCPSAFQCLSNVPLPDLVRSNLFAFAWGIAVVLACICYLRIGVGLTMAILIGIGIPVGTITTLIFKGSGLFSNAPDLGSWAGLLVLGGVVLMLIGVAIIAMAGFGRDRQLKMLNPSAGGFGWGLIMTVISGLLVGCMNFAFVYGQDPVLGNLSLIRPGDSISVTATVEGAEKLKGEYPVDENGKIRLGKLGCLTLDGPSAWHAARQIRKQFQAVESTQDVQVHVETGSVPALFGAFAVPLAGGMIPIVAYGVYLLFKNRSWGVFAASGTDLTLALVMGLHNTVALALWGKGTLLLGAIGASIGWGISRATQIISSQGLGFFSGEWRGVHGKPRFQMYLAIGILIIGGVIMAYGKRLANR
jgi:hypothetical protein